MNNNLQMIDENEGEFQNTNDHIAIEGVMDDIQVQQIERDINLMQQQEVASNKFNSDRMPTIQYENDED